jgi:hypothetical protein
LLKTCGKTLCRQFKSLLWLGLLTSFSYPAFAIDYTFLSSPFAKSYNKLLEDKADRQGSKMYLLWSMESNASSYSSEIDNAFYFQFKSSGKLKYQILDRLSLDLKANVLFQGGQAQSRFSELLPSGPAYLSYGFFNLDVLGNESFEVQAGALSQTEVFGSSLFISQRSFPGIGESIKFSKDNYKLKLSAQQVVPTTFTFSTSLVEREKTPTLNSANINLSYDDDIFHFGVMGGVFNYSNLPHMVADASRLYGNSVVGTGFASEFVFDYAGWLAGFDSAYSPTKDTTLRFAVNMLENSGAPRTYNQAQVIQVSGHHRLNSDIGFDVLLTDFFIESDAVPAFFTSRTYGQTNREGYSIELGMQWIEKKVRVSAAYTVSNLISADPSERQQDNDIISINLETAYDLFN